MSAKTFPLALGLLSALAAPAPADEKHELAAKAQAVFKTHCYRCHGQDGSIEGGLNYVGDLGKLVARGKVVPGNAAASRLFKRLDEGTMPPPDETPRPTAAEVASVRKWIEAGAPAAGTTAPRPVVSQSDVLTAVLADLGTMDGRARRFQRYFTLHHLANAGLSDEELQTYRNALSKLVNSLSWNSKVAVPVAVDPAKTVLRIDLRWYTWDAATWNRILQEYPYGVLDDTIAARAVSVDTAAKVPVVRGDWFVATASRAPLYYDVLQLPANLADLERQLRVDSTLNIQQERVVRVGFNGSGISRFNRVLERHDSAQGMYWRTYDFDEPPANLTERANGNLLPDRRNIFAFPLGPNVADSPFTHAGGEAIFALPNGLHAFFLANAANARLDKGPIAIVSDPKRPDRAVEAGVSCMSCHTTGVLPKADQIRDHLAKNPAAFTRTDADTIRALYPAKEKSLEAMQDDARRYAEAVAKTGAKVSKYEAVSTMTLKYEADLDLPAAAAEVGLSSESFRAKIDQSETLAKHVGTLRTAGGTVGRAVWVQAFGDTVRELRLGTLFQANLNGPTRSDNTGELDPLDVTGGAANQIAFTADGRRAVVASGDRTVRFFDVEGRRDIKRFIGHTASVWSVALSEDGKTAASGSTDGTARVWDIATGLEQRRFSGHTSLVSAVALTADAKWAVSGGFDGVVAMWDVATGQERWRVERLGPVAAVVIDPKEEFVLVAAGRTVRTFAFDTGKLLRETVELKAPVGCLALSPDGKWFAAGDDAGGVHAWRTAGDYWFQQTGHAGPVRSVAIRTGGRWLLSAGSDATVRLWNTTDVAKEVAAFRKHTAPVVSAAFLANGTQTVSGDRNLGLLPWTIDRFLTAPASVPVMPSAVETVTPTAPPPRPKLPSPIPYAKP